MFDTQNNPSYRAISIITLIQAGVIVGGVLIVTAILKAKGYGQGEVPDWFFRSDALFMRHAGFTLLLIPAAWALSTALLARLEANIWIQWSMIAAGIAAVLFGMWYFMLLAFNPCIL
jgi:hypothetical protein